MAKELIQINQIQPLELFTKEGTDSILKEIEEQVKSFVGDISTPAGRHEIKSMAYKITRSKTTLDDLGKNLVSDWKAKSKLVDNERKKIRETLDEWRDEVKQPLTDFENAEKERIEIRQKRIESIQFAVKNLDMITPGFLTSDLIKEKLEELEELEKFDWQEFEHKANTEYLEAHKYFTQVLDGTLKREAEQAELEKLRKEKEEREKKEREKQIIRETEENIRRVEREKAERVAKEAEEERYRLEAEKKAAEQAKINAENRAKATVKRAKEEKEHAENRAKAVQEEAIRLERARAEAEKQKEIDEAKAREADIKHRTKINNEAASQLEELIKRCENYCGFGQYEFKAKEIIKAIVKGEIPHLTINY